MLKFLRLGPGELVELEVGLGVSLRVEVFVEVEVADGVVEVEDLLRFVFGGEHVKEIIKSIMNNHCPLAKE